ncbi:MAG: hypothetical protein BVN34_07860 [Proteobacteria bacterium ST_bin12]|nr:MAG: hypothetical protein BVN34_07860 [Proteobacteria bacterium ST_bin12]
MEWLLFGLLGVVICIGGFVGFIGLFNKGDAEQQLKNIEHELTQLKKRLHALEAKQLPTQQSLAQIATPTDSQTTLQPDNTADAPQAKPKDLTQSTKQNNEIKTAAIPVNIEASSTQRINLTASNALNDSKTITPESLNIIEQMFALAKNWLFGGNTMVRAGVVILFIGISFLLKMVVDNGIVPIQLRLVAIAVGGLGLLATGWRLREKRAQYAWALQGGGVGVLYLTIFSALKLYGLIPAGTAFTLLAAVAFLSALMAIKQSAMPLAILGFTGGFLAPILTSTGDGSHVGLFSYYLVLNVAIAFIAFYKSWRPLNILGWGFTFIVGSLWGAKNYTPTYFASTEPFLIIFFLLFTLIAVLFAHRQATKASDYIDATLVFGTPLVSFSLQYALLKNTPYGMAYSALIVGVFYLALAWWLFTRKRETLQFLGEYFLALGIGFATLTIPLSLDGRWTSAAWAVEGVGLLWVGLKQQRLFPTLSGLALQLLGAGAFMVGWGLTGLTPTAHQNMCLGVAFIALSGWACGALLNHYQHSKFAFTAPLLAVWGWLWWVGAGLTAIDTFLPPLLFAHAALTFVAMTSVILPLVSSKIKWPALANLSCLLLPVMAFVLAIDFLSGHPFAHMGFYTWLITLVAYIWLLMRHVMPSHAVFRGALLWIAAIIGGIEWQHYLSAIITSGVWLAIGWAVVPLIISAGIMQWQKHHQNAAINRAWIWVGIAPIMVFLCAWFMFMSLDSNGSAAPLSYIPLLNPLDITLCAILFKLLLWTRHFKQYFLTLKKNIYIIAGLMAFILINGMLLRTLHHWAGTPFQWTAIFSNATVQMAFTFLWGVSAFVLMLLAHKQAKRMLWMVGAALMSLVVLKLFFFDLAQQGSVARIASFIGAGVMLLIMGYFAPLPPTNHTK